MISLSLSKMIRKYSFFGIFRFGRKINIDIKIYCDTDGKIFYKVINGPPHLDYQKILGKSFEATRKELMHLWNVSRRQSRIVIKPKIHYGPENINHSFTSETTRIRRSVDLYIDNKINLEYK
jgi:hypothetical protein